MDSSIRFTLVSFGFLALATAQYGFGACNPGCIGESQCVAGGCQCMAPSLVYQPVIGCVPQPAPYLPVGPAPVVVPRLIPQALPGAPCEPGVECTGGSVCSLGICVCPPELVQEGTVCVARTVYGVVPPPIIPVPVMPSIPMALVPVGAACAPMRTQCVRGAACGLAGVCQCSTGYTPTPQGQCFRRRRARVAGFKYQN
ncbi:unnamed protein product, partial [Mesorhabditis belari]|uniref:EB domain-containing protein n=1 Tax=Mesorhabditis belari TaxID=2138241 RepID=A0AAF3E871_9BILA